MASAAEIVALFERLAPEAVTTGAVKRINRVVGRIAGRAAVLDEVFPDSMPTDGGGWSFHGWIVRFELPAPVAGHLRVRLPYTIDANGPAPAALLTDALFDRLRATRTVQVAAAGRDLWVVACRAPGEAFTSSSMIGYDLESWRRAAATLDEVAGIADTVSSSFRP